MKVCPKAGLLAVVALLATTAVATSAQAVTINPDNAAVSGVSSNMNFSYGVMFVSCDTATMDGTTGLDSDRISDLALTFTDNCSVAGVGPATVDCSGDVTLIAQSAATDTGTLELNDGFQCVFTMAVCSVTVSGPQTTQNNNLALDAANDTLSANVGFQATRTGSAWCGPASGTATFAADYAMSPSTLAIDP
jgi:hypothetical protein